MGEFAWTSAGEREREISHGEKQQLKGDTGSSERWALSEQGTGAFNLLFVCHPNVASLPAGVTSRSQPQPLPGAVNHRGCVPSPGQAQMALWWQRCPCRAGTDPQQSRAGWILQWHGRFSISGFKDGVMAASCTPGSPREQSWHFGILVLNVGLIVLLKQYFLSCAGVQE